MKQSKNQKKNYREDINGLRAWAVSAVILYHLSFSWLPGGFIGVDVFFVISGYLMTSIILESQLNKKFSLISFYLARLRRILPALLTLLTLLMLIGWFFLPNIEYVNLAEESLYVLGFVSNYHYAESFGYFDLDSKSKWLLNTWSLAIEAQFYITFPLLIALITKATNNINSIKWHLLVITIISFISNVIYSSIDPTNSFYSFHHRMWELLIGGCVYLFTHEKLIHTKYQQLSSLVGVCIILLGYILIDEKVVWPGYFVTVPILGTCLILISPRAENILVINQCTKWVGERSYSLYLWHWPLVVWLWKYGLEGDYFWLVTILLCCITISHLSFLFIENTSRNIISKLPSSTQILLFSIAIAILYILLTSIKFGVLDTRVSSDINLIAEQRENYNPRRETCEQQTEKLDDLCVFGKEKIDLLALGDSHLGATISALEAAAIKYDKGISYAGLTSCPTIYQFRYQGDNLKIKKRRQRCNVFLQKVKEKLINTPKNISIITISRTAGYIYGPNEKNRITEKLELQSSKYLAHNLSQISKTACEIQKNNQLYLVRPIPEMGRNVPDELIYRINRFKFNDDIRITKEQYFIRNQEIWDEQDKAAKNCGVKILNPLPYLCDEKYCYGSKNGFPLYYDDDHLSEHGNKLLIPMFEKIFAESNNN